LILFIFLLNKYIYVVSNTCLVIHAN
jgi:hypothetical protein